MSSIVRRLGDLFRYPAWDEFTLRYNIKTLLIITAIFASLLTAILIVNGAIQTRAIVNVDHPNGTRLRVIQYFNYQPELFTTSIYFDDGDGKWRWYYFDHQDSYWGGAKIEISDNEIRVTSKYRNIEFDTSSGECTTFRSGIRRFHEKSDTTKSLPSGFEDAPNPRKAG